MSKDNYRTQRDGFISERSEERKQRRQGGGFTLVELLLYISLVAIFVSAATVSLLDIILGSTKSSIQQEVQENLRYASQRIQFEIRNADTINPGSSFGTNLVLNPATVVSFVSSSPNNPTEIRVSEGILQIKQGSGDWTALTSSTLEVEELVFTDLSDTGSENVRFTVTVRYRNPDVRSEWEKEATFETAAQLR